MKITDEARNYLLRLGIKDLNKMQNDALKLIEDNDKLILLSATGSGKTVAFLLPLIASLDKAKKEIQSLIIVPSRELALQIENVIKTMQTGFKVTCCYGGHKREIEENSLVEPPAILIGTTGRLCDHIRRGSIDLSNVNFLVMDEFDKMLELGFQEEVEFIFKSLPSTLQKKMITSATNSREIPEFVSMEDAEILNSISAFSEDNLRVNTLLSPDKDKLMTLFQLLCYANNTSSIVFCNHRDSVERTSNFLTEHGIVNVFYHGGMEQREREVALCKFRNGTSDILVTTDLASRGLDIDNIRNIIHYHIALDESSFTHRNGRTARMNTTGNVYVIYSIDEKLPPYLTEVASTFDLPEKLSIPEKPKWSTLFIDAGKKDKINKIDIVGFLSNKGNLKKDDIGLIEVKDFFAFAAVRKLKVGQTLELIKDEKMKNKKVKIAIAK
ncbi:MAG: DEAD/DEAH box helicase [Ferruginibacter sp.]